MSCFFLVIVQNTKKHYIYYNVKQRKQHILHFEKVKLKIKKCFSLKN